MQVEWYEEKRAAMKSLQFVLALLESGFDGTAQSPLASQIVHVLTEQGEEPT